MPATLSSSNEQTILGPHPVKIGRAWDNQLVLNDPTVSSHHAEIRAQGQDYIIVDLGSTNGTFVNEQRLDRNVARLLISGDTIRIGEKIFTYYNDTGVTRTPSLPLNPFSFDEYEDSTLHSAKIGVKATGASFPAPPPPYTSRPPHTEHGSPPPTPPAPQQPYAPSPALQSPPQYRAPSANYPLSRQAPTRRRRSATPPPSSSILPEQLQFTAFHPKVVVTGIWHTLLVYAHIESALWSVRADAARFRAEMGPIPGEISTQAKIPLLRGTEITIVLTCQGVIFGPERVSFKWAEDWHPTAFRFQADKTLAGSAENGEISVYAGPVLIATLKIAFLFEEQSPYPASPSFAGKNNTTEVSARLYKQIFTSYSHADTPVVLAFRSVYKALGFQVLIDIDTLRSGQNWNTTLMKLIDDSDIFQLFWSPRSARSQYVRQEWEYALRYYKGEGFIRPVYWKEPLVPPPPELSMLHFAYVQLPKPRISDYGRLFYWGISNIFRRDE